MATLKDIAREAGVSITTVSNVVNNNHHKVSPQLTERIKELLQKHHYVPNQSARVLSLKVSQMVAIIIQQDYMQNALTDPYVGELVGSVLLALQEIGFDTMIRITNDYTDINQSLRQWNVAGAIFTGSYDINICRLSEQMDIPLVFIDSYASSRNINNVGIDDYMGGKLAAEYLLGMGHRRIAFIAPGLGKSEVDEQRRRGFSDAVRAAGVEPMKPEWFIRDADDAHSLAEALIRYMPEVTAAFVTADLRAIKLIAGLSELGVNVPEDMSVVGFDDLQHCNFTDPRLTTIRQDIEGKARMAVDIMLRHMQDRKLDFETVLMDVKLVERSSVRRITGN